jgi:MoaA/NifB/PqqE/SkfB family radical SAM enzyme
VEQTADDGRAPFPIATAQDIKLFNFAALAFEVTDECPLRCRSCLRNCSPENHRVISKASVLKVVDSLSRDKSVREIGFSGGECFLFPELLEELCLHIHDRLGLPITMATNGFWAESVGAARDVLDPLVRAGLSSLLVSVDDFHLEFLEPQTIQNCVDAATAAGLRVTLQVITTRRSRRIPDFQALLSVADPASVDWIENSCDPVGRAVDCVAPETMWRRRLSRRGICSVFRLVSIRLDGRALPCCGSGSEAPGMAIGNAFTEDIGRIIQRAEASPIMNSLALYGGPLHLLRVLASRGRGELLKRAFTSPCEACHALFSSDELLEILSEALEDRWLDLYSRRLGLQAKLIAELRKQRAAGLADRTTAPMAEEGRKVGSR